MQNKAGNGMPLYSLILTHVDQDNILNDSLVIPSGEVEQVSSPMHHQDWYFPFLYQAFDESDSKT